jgi:hypothetical protein
VGKLFNSAKKKRELEPIVGRRPNKISLAACYNMMSVHLYFFPMCAFRASFITIIMKSKFYFLKLLQVKVITIFFIVSDEINFSNQTGIN